MTDTSVSGRLGSSRRVRPSEQEHTLLMFRQLPGAAWITDRDLRIQQYIGYLEENLDIPHESVGRWRFRRPCSTRTRPRASGKELEHHRRG